MANTPADHQAQGVTESDLDAMLAFWTEESGPTGQTIRLLAEEVRRLRRSPAVHEQAQGVTEERLRELIADEELGLRYDSDPNNWDRNNLTANDEESLQWRRDRISAMRELLSRRSAPATAEADMADVGRAFMAKLPKSYSWCQCPTEYVTDLQNELNNAETHRDGYKLQAAGALLTIEQLKAKLAPPSPASVNAEVCDTCKGFRVVNIDDWHQQPCPDCTGRKPVGEKPNV